MSDRSFDDLEGEFGGYEIQVLIGKGPATAVYAASKEDRPVALKVLKAKASRYAKERFEREGRLGETVKHPAILAVRERGEEEGLQYLVQDLASSNVEQQLEAGETIGWEKSAELLLTILGGLRTLHEASVIHRDIRPANIFEVAGAFKLGGCGTALELGLDGGAATDGKIVVTGNPNYMPAEQFRFSDRVEPNADLYALGATAFQLMTKELIFPDQDRGELLESHERRDPPKLRARAKEAPRVLQDLIERLLAKKPRHRCQSAAEVSGILSGILKGSLKELPDFLDEDSGEELGVSGRAAAAASSRTPAAHSGRKKPPSERVIKAAPISAKGEGDDKADPKNVAILIGVVILSLFMAFRVYSILTASNPLYEAPKFKTTRKIALLTKKLKPQKLVLQAGKTIEVSYALKVESKTFYRVRYRTLLGFLPADAITLPPGYKASATLVAEGVTLPRELGGSGAGVPDAKEPEPKKPDAKEPEPKKSE